MQLSLGKLLLLWPWAALAQATTKSALWSSPHRTLADTFKPRGRERPLMPSDQQTRTAEAAEKSNWGQSCAARCPTCRQLLLHSEAEARPHPTTTRRSSAAELKLPAGGQARPRHVLLVAPAATESEVCSKQGRGVDDATAALDAAIALTSLDHKIQGDAISEFIRAGRKRPFSAFNVFVSWFYKNLDVALRRESGDSVADLSPFETLRLLLGQPGSTTPDKVLRHSRRRCHKERCAPPSAPPSCASARELGRLWKDLEQNFPELKQQCDKVASADQKIYKTVKKSRQQL